MIQATSLVLLFVYLFGWFFIPVNTRRTGNLAFLKVCRSRSAKQSSWPPGFCSGPELLIAELCTRHALPGFQFPQKAPQSCSVYDSHSTAQENAPRCSPQLGCTWQHRETQPSRGKAQVQHKWEQLKRSWKKKWPIETKAREKQCKQILSVIKHLILPPYKAGTRERSKSNQTQKNACLSPGKKANQINKHQRLKISDDKNKIQSVYLFVITAVIHLQFKFWFCCVTLTKPLFIHLQNWYTTYLAEGFQIWIDVLHSLLGSVFQKCFLRFPSNWHRRGIKYCY